MVGTNVWPGYEPLYLARELKLFHMDDIKLAEYSSATQVLRAFRNETIQVGAITLDEMLLLRESGLDVCIILVTDISNGSDVILAQPGIKSMQDLKGKRVGVENTALGAYVLSRALQQAGMEPKDVNTVPLEIDEHLGAMEKKQIDAVVTFDPIKIRLQARGMELIFNSAMIPGEIVDVLVVRQETMALYQDRLIKLLEGWFQALYYLKTQPESAAKIMAPRMQIDPEGVLDSYKDLLLPGLEQNITMLSGPHPSLDQTMSRLSEIMKETSLLDPHTRIGRVACPDILNQLKNRSSLEPHDATP